MSSNITPPSVGWLALETKRFSTTGPTRNLPDTPPINRSQQPPALCNAGCQCSCFRCRTAPVSATSTASSRTSVDLGRLRGPDRTSFGIEPECLIGTNRGGLRVRKGLDLRWIWRGARSDRDETVHGYDPMHFSGGGKDQGCKPGGHRWEREWKMRRPTVPHACWFARRVSMR